MKNYNFTFEKLGLFFGISIFTLILFILNYSPKINKKNKNTILVVQSINFKEIQTINVSNLNKKHKFISDSIYVLVSTTCPHCKNLLKIINESNFKFDSVLVMPIFSNKTNKKEIITFLKMENLDLDVAFIKNKSVLDSIKFVPTFIHFKNQKINYFISTSVSNITTLKELCASITSKSWIKDKNSVQSQACAH